MRQQRNTEHYDDVANMLTPALHRIRVARIPEQELPPVLVDFAIWAALRIAGTTGGEALLKRMRGQVVEWDFGEHPIQDLMRRRGETAPRPDRIFEKHRVAGAPLRKAMEHLLSHERLELEQAARCLVSYAVALVGDRLGPERAREMLESARSEIDLLKTETAALTNGD